MLTVEQRIAKAKRKLQQASHFIQQAVCALDGTEPPPAPVQRGYRMGAKVQMKKGGGKMYN
jgi:hypothetical protein